MTTYELKREWFDQLKFNLFHNEEEWSDDLTPEEVATIEDCTCPEEIPDSIVHHNYEGTEFVDEDFSPAEDVVKYDKIYTVEDVCHAFSQPLNQHEVVQARLERVLEYLVEQNVIEYYDEEKLDWVFSDECSY